MEIPGRRSEKHSGFSGWTSEEMTESSSRVSSEWDYSAVAVGSGMDMMRLGPVGKDTTPYKTWAQQTEESYQLQLALALRLSSDATSADDPNVLDSATDVLQSRPRSTSAEALSHRFWVNGCMSYHDKVPDGFYLIHGMDPYVWNISNDVQDVGRIPSFDSLKVVDMRKGSSIEVVLIDISRDLGLKDFTNTVLSLSRSWKTEQEMVANLAQIVCRRMGGTMYAGEDCFNNHWKECTNFLKGSLGSVVLPLGSLSVGFCVHRALLFKLLADMLNLPCRIAKGCKTCGRDFASSCLVRFSANREYIVDLIGRPGYLSPPDSLLNGIASIVVSSPLCHPRFKAVERADDYKTLARLYFSNCLSVNIKFDSSSSGAIDKDKTDRMLHEQKNSDRSDLVSYSGPSDYMESFNLTDQTLRNDHRDVKEAAVFPNLWHHEANNPKFTEPGHLAGRISHNKFSLHDEDLEIQWSDLVLKEKIGSGSFGSVHLAEWRGSVWKLLLVDTENHNHYRVTLNVTPSIHVTPTPVLEASKFTYPTSYHQNLLQDVAVKVLNEQGFHDSGEFLKEVAVMKRLRHPNIVLLMGAVSQPPRLSIVMEYLSRGSLFKLLQMRDAGVVLNERRRLNMAYDVANGMNYLHQLKPPIVHRDLKSLNLLVDSKYTVKVCDFGLSCSKANTYLSSKTAAGTPEWMAPEVLREEPSNEKADIYSFGVVLWELMTLQRPWRDSTHLQVIAAVAFEGKRLEIPSEVNPQVASLIEACWANDPWKRPSFSFIMAVLQQLMSSSLDQPGPSSI